MTATALRLPFADRAEAGRLLGEAVRDRLGASGSHGSVVLGIPRGGVVVAAAVADALSAPLDVAVARKIGAPWQRELAIGAATADGTVMVEAWATEVGADERYVTEESARQVQLAQEQESRLRSGRQGVSIVGRIVVLVDDGIATGATMHAAVLAARGAGAARVVVAVPVGARESIERLAAIADDVVVLATPSPFYAVGEFYVSFRQTSDEEVVALLGGRGA